MFVTFIILIFIASKNTTLNEGLIHKVSHVYIVSVNLLGCYDVDQIVWA